MIETYVPATHMNAPASTVSTASVVLSHLLLIASSPPFKWYVSYSQKKPATPYVYHDAKREAVIPVRYEKMGTALARTNATATDVKQSRTHVDHPRTVWE